MSVPGSSFGLSPLVPSVYYCGSDLKKCPPKAVPVKPNKQFFRSVSLNQASSIVSIGNGYVAYYVAAPSEADFVDINNIDLSDHIYIFRVKKFGRFCSVDLSDRCLIDSINKFLEV